MSDSKRLRTFYLYSIIDIISYLMFYRNRMKLILKHAYDLVNFVKVAIE